MILHAIKVYVRIQSAININGKKKCENKKAIPMQFEIQNNHPTVRLQVFHQYRNC